MPFDAKIIDKSPSKSSSLYENLCEEQQPLEHSEQIKDLEDKLGSLDNIEISCQSIHHYLTSIKDSVQICQEIVTRIKIQKPPKEDEKPCEIKNFFDNLNAEEEKLRKDQQEVAEFQIVDYFKAKITELVQTECKGKDEAVVK